MTYNVEDELKRLKQKWDKKEDELHLLFTLTQDLAFTRNVDLLLDRVVERASQVMRAEASSLLLMNPETLLLDFVVVKGQSSEAIRNLDIHLRPGEGVAGWVVASQQHAIVNNVEDDPRFKPEVDWLTGFHTRNLMAVPLVVKGKTLGVIEVINKLDGKEFTEDDAQFLRSVAWLSAMALDNAQVYRALEDSQEYLTNILESLSGGFIGVNMKGKVTHCNSRAKEILGFSHDVIHERYTRSLASQPEIVKIFETTFEEKRELKRQEVDLQTPWKGQRKIGYSLTLIRNRAGDFQGIGLMFQDITEVSPSS